MRPKRFGASGRTATMAAPGFRLRYSSAISSAGVLERTTLAISLSASRTSACCASSMASNRTVGFDIVACLYIISANEAKLPARPSIHHRAAGRPPLRVLAVQTRLLLAVLARSLPPAPHGPEKEQ